MLITSTMVRKLHGLGMMLADRTLGTPLVSSFAVGQAGIDSIFSLTKILHRARALLPINGTRSEHI